MSNLKNPLLSLDARGTLSKAITFVKRRKQNIAEKKPEILDAQTTAQLSWRHMFNKCTALWHALSAVEQADWESLARSRHMTGYAYWQSQCLRPNPGIYLPLQGGTMSGDIDMAKNRVLKLPLPTDSQEAASKAYVDAGVASATYTEGARVFHDAIQLIPNNVGTILSFNSERWDTDTIHDIVISNSRLTCKTAGKYSIMGNIEFAVSTVGDRSLQIYLNGATFIAYARISTVAGIAWSLTISTIYDLDIGDFVEIRVIQTSGAPLNLVVSSQLSPEFMMQRIG